MKKYYSLFAALVLLSSCNDKKPVSVSKANIPADTIVIETKSHEDSIEGIYETKPENNNADDCKISLEINKTKNGYSYFLKTKTRQLKGISNFITEESGEKYLVLEGIKWDEYEGDISNEENDSVSGSKELEIPVGITAGYVKDTLTIQNYGNAMNSYTKLSECGRKYIQLIKK
ncbi:hypothetical protein [Flavobacterium defluvii]|uniref:Lipoprotein n=1 Tax=Flavobacterium defluvii TaxID=370979 RepID=A0A1M5L2Y9_9FLAO|nr:hypothetical protein [Flavobacterium defluvii]SHG59290.1 hypothetical protein SAMN05443663_103253 [Flavobacterium defluvii]